MDYSLKHEDLRSPLKIGGRWESRTPTTSRSSTGSNRISTPHATFQKWYSGRESNPQPLESKSSASSNWATWVWWCGKESNLHRLIDIATGLQPAYLATWMPHLGIHGESRTHNYEGLNLMPLPIGPRGFGVHDRIRTCINGICNPAPDHSATCTFWSGW